MKNITISMEEELARWVRVKAAERDMSVSRYIREMLHRQMQQAEEYRRAMKKNIVRRPRDLSGGRAYPGRAQRGKLTVPSSATGMRKAPNSTSPSRR